MAYWYVGGMGMMHWFERLASHNHHQISRKKIALMAMKGRMTFTSAPP